MMSEIKDDAAVKEAQQIVADLKARLKIIFDSEDDQEMAGMVIFELIELLNSQAFIDPTGQIKPTRFNESDERFLKCLELVPSVLRAKIVIHEKYNQQKNKFFNVN